MVLLTEHMHKNEHIDNIGRLTGFCHYVSFISAATNAINHSGIALKWFRV